MKDAGTLETGLAVDDPAAGHHGAGAGPLVHLEDLEVLHGLVDVHRAAL